MLAHSFMQVLGNTANLGCNGFNGGPLGGGAFATVILHHTQGTFEYFGGKRVDFLLMTPSSQKWESLKFNGLFGNEWGGRSTTIRPNGAHWLGDCGKCLCARSRSGSGFDHGPMQSCKKMGTAGPHWKARRYALAHAL